MRKLASTTVLLTLLTATGASAEYTLDTLGNVEVVTLEKHWCKQDAALYFRGSSVREVDGKALARLWPKFAQRLRRTCSELEAVLVIADARGRPVFTGISGVQTSWRLEESKLRLSGTPATRHPTHPSAAPAGMRQSEQVLLDGIENTFWVADGNYGERPLYVLYAPWCSACRSLALRSEELSRQVQIRWIPVDARSDPDQAHLAELAAVRDAEVIRTHFRRRTVRSGDTKMAKLINTAGNMVISAIQHQLQETLGEDEPFGFPTLVYVNQQNELVIKCGVPADLETLASDVSSRPAAALLEPSSLDFLQAPGKSVGGQTELPQPTWLRAGPTDDFVVLGLVDAGAALDMRIRVKMHGEVWVGLAAFTDGTLGYVRERELQAIHSNQRGAGER